YIDQIGPIESLQDLEHARFIGLDRNAEMIAYLADFGLHLSPDQFRYNSPSGRVLYELVRLGLGISILTKDIESHADTIVPILPEAFSIPIPVWLVTHRELHTSKRIRVVYDVLAEELAKSAFI
ncbi:MAG: LysR substrate-binding domain-containing protein, partial [Pseudomonadota bacterium]